MKTSNQAAMPEEPYLAHFLGAIALETAWTLGVIERLSSGGGLTLTELGIAPPGGEILMGLLLDAGVCQRAADDADGKVHYDLTLNFANVLRTRGPILEQKLFFLRLAARDLLDGFPDLLFDLPKFMEQSQTFSLFRYDKAMNTDPDSLAHTRRWADYVTALTEAEAGFLVPEIDLSGATRLLEIGGNTGAFALHLLQAFPGLQASVLDLPAVCRLGRDYVRDRPGADRLQFVAGDARHDAWPDVNGKPANAILFKSVLHDWPDADAGDLLDRAEASLPPGGRVIVCERGPLRDEFGQDNGQGSTPFSMTGNLVFCRFYRDPSFYVAELERRGFIAVQVRQVRIEMAFNIVIATKPGVKK